MNGLVNRTLAKLLRLFFYLLYNPFAWCYDWVAAAVSLNHWQEWVSSVIPYLSGKRILELGHGPGHLQVAMHRLDLQVFGLDLSSRMTRQAHRRLKRLALSAGLVRARAQQTPFIASTFDCVVSTFPSEYLFQSQTLSEIFRVLIPGGLLIVLPVAWPHHNSWLERSLAWLFQVTHQSPPQEDIQWKSRLSGLFQEAGFQVRSEIISQSGSDILLILAYKPKLL